MTAPSQPTGISFHDELQNTSEKNRVEKQTTAPVVNGIPQGPGFDGAASDADTEQGDEGMTVGSDPADFTVAEVKAYLATADEAETTRVLAAERDGKARTSLLS